MDTVNSKIIYDADRLVNLELEYDIQNKEEPRKIISKVFLTLTGRKIAEEIYF